MTHAQKIDLLRGYLYDLWENRLDEQSAEQLGRLLEENPQLREVYIQATHLHAGLVSWSMGPRDQQLVQQLHDAETRYVDRATASTRDQFPLANVRSDAERPVGRRRVLGWAAAIAASVLAGLAGLAASSWWGDSPQAPEVALSESSGGENAVASASDPVSDRRPDKAWPVVGDPEADAPEATAEAYVAQILHLSTDVRWGDGSTATDFLFRLRKGERLVVVEGVVELRHESGAQVTLVGPAEYIARGPALGELIGGALRSRVEGGNFRLITPTADVIDLGTEFGVAVDGDGRTDVLVFEGAVHVSPAQRSESADAGIRLATGDTASVLHNGAITADLKRVARTDYPRPLSGGVSPLSPQRSLSMVDLINRKSQTPGVEPLIVSTINPVTGSERPQPWTQDLGPGDVAGSGLYHVTLWHPVIDGVFIPTPLGKNVQVDSGGSQVDLPSNTGVTWGPVWSRRKTHASVSKFGRFDFWGNLTVPVLQDRFESCESGMVGMHANVGLCFDLEAIRQRHEASPRRFRTIVANLDNSREHNLAIGYEPEVWPRYAADLRVYVDGELVASRLDFTRADGEAVIQADLEPGDRFLSIVSTDASATSRHKAYDHVVLIDPEFE